MKKKNRQKSPSGLEEYYKDVGGRKLRLGYTTGSCAAAASKAAAYMLLTGRRLDEVSLMTPKGISLHLQVLDITLGKEEASCAVQKDAGDDPDITDGILIYAKVCKRQPSAGEQWFPEENIAEPGFERQPGIKGTSIRILGGLGVGVVTKPGLDQPPGAAAINQAPRKMITEELERICQEFHYRGTLEVEISAPQGEMLAQKTFNPRLGILGGISILGTTGIVEPMSESALISSIRLELSQQAELGRKSLVVTPGNYGQTYLQQHFPFSLNQGIKCSNYVGETIDFAAQLGIENLLFVAHIGKFIKVAGGIFQTHSQYADARMEILTANAVLAGAGQPLLTELMMAATTEEGLGILERAGYLEQTMKHVTAHIQSHLERRSAGRLQIGAVIFSSGIGSCRLGNTELGRTEHAKEIIEKIRIETKRQERVLNKRTDRRIK